MSIWCEVRAEGCWGHASQTHHRKLRSQGGGNEPENLARVCTPCHVFLHANPAWSYERGWLVKSWDSSVTETATAVDSEVGL